MVDGYGVASMFKDETDDAFGAVVSGPVRFGFLPTEKTRTPYRMSPFRIRQRQ